MSAEDYYYKITSNGAKRYYDLLSGSLIPKAQIPPNIINDIAEFDNRILIGEKLLNLRNEEAKLQEKIKLLQQQLNNVSLNIKQVELLGGIEGIRLKHEFESNIAQRKQRNQQPNRHTTSQTNPTPSAQSNSPPRTHSNTQSNTNTPPRSPGNAQSNTNTPPKPKSNTYSSGQSYKPVTYEGLLNENGIFTKKDWKEWLIRNHTDKNAIANEDLLKNIITAGRGIGW